MKIIFIEDVKSWVTGLEYAVSPYFNKQGIKLDIIALTDGSMILQELMANNIDYIFIDYDLGGSYGDEIIEELKTSPDFNRIPIIFYSAGLSIVELKEKSNSFGGITCLTKNDVESYLVNLI